MRGDIGSAPLYTTEPAGHARIEGGGGGVPPRNTFSKAITDMSKCI